MNFISLGLQMLTYILTAPEVVTLTDTRTVVVVMVAAAAATVVATAAVVVAMEEEVTAAAVMEETLVLPVVTACPTWAPV